MTDHSTSLTQQSDATSSGTANRMSSRRRRAGLGLGVSMTLALGIVATSADPEASASSTLDDLIEQQEENERQRQDLVEDREGIETEREELEASLEGVDADLAQTYLDLEETQDRIPVVQGELVQAEEDLAAAELEQELVEGRLEVAQTELEDLELEMAEGEALQEESQEALGELARSTYRGDAAPSTLDLIFRVDSTDEFLDSFVAMGAAVRTQTSVLDDITDANATARNQGVRQDALILRIDELNDEALEAITAADLARIETEERRDELLELEEQQVVLADELEEASDDLSGQIVDAQLANDDVAIEIAQIDADNRDLASQQEDEEERILEEERLRQEAIEREQQLEEERQQREAAPPPAPAPSPNPAPAPSPDPAPAPSPDPAPSPSPSPSPDPPPAPDPPPTSATFQPPVPRPLHITSGYGYRIYPITGGWFMHPGVDLRSACGEAQTAVASGTVSSVRGAYGNGTHGNQIFINHGIINGRSTVSVYNHLSSFAVSSGQTVSQGQRIGNTGQTGAVTGCHVHLEIWLDGSHVDPMQFL